MMQLSGLFVICLVVAIVQSATSDETIAWWGVGGLGIFLLIGAIFNAGRTKAITSAPGQHPREPGSP